MVAVITKVVQRHESKGRFLGPLFAMNIGEEATDLDLYGIVRPGNEQWHTHRHSGSCLFIPEELSVECLGGVCMHAVLQGLGSFNFLNDNIQHVW